MSKEQSPNAHQALEFKSLLRGINSHCARCEDEAARRLDLMDWKYNNADVGQDLHVVHT